MDSVINTEWGRTHLDESLGLVGGPSCLRLTILTELALGEVVDGINSHGLESEGAQFKASGTRYVALA